MTQPAPVQALIKRLSKFPGIGSRSAQKMVLYCLTQRQSASDMQKELQSVLDSVQECKICGNLALENPCHICISEKRPHDVLCVVEGVDDLWALEEAGTFAGRYHVLGGVLSALDGVGPDELRLKSLIKRASAPEVTEVILALGASVDGQTTAHYVAQQLADCGVQVTTLAKGMPVGAELDYMDAGTLALALQYRTRLD
jgi:recombination protein RecR